MKSLLFVAIASLALNVACLGCKGTESTAGTAAGGGGPTCQEGDSLFCKCEGHMDGHRYCIPGTGEYGTCECPNNCDQVTVSCESCNECAVDANCSQLFDKCINNYACAAMGECFVNQCNNDYLCFFECAKQHPTGADDYIALLECIQCDACSNNCSPSAICSNDCYTQCDLTFPSGVTDLSALAQCAICDSCSQDCVDYCPASSTQACGITGDCNACVNGSCAMTTCAVQFSQCEGNLDCGSLNDCYGSCQ